MNNSGITNLRIDREALADIASDKAILEPLLRVSSAINEIRETDPFLERLLEEMAAHLPAERAAVLLTDLQAVVFRPSAFEIKTEIAAQALREQSVILFNASESLLSAPVRIRESNLGVVYFENSAVNAFTPAHLRLLAAMAGVAAGVWDRWRSAAKLQGENEHLRKYAYTNHGLLGASAAMRKVHDFIDKVANSSSTVLILGESGTGKELVARGIHGNSRRAGPFVALNCGAVREELVETELFGHEKGAFTSAGSQKQGLVEIADGGTLFLDEIGELPLTIQAALLRFLQEREFRRIGGTRTLHADVRIVAATNRNLEEWIQQGRFRHDLYYRLNVATIRTPPLSEMRADIPLLVDRLLEKLRDARPVGGISDEALGILTAYHWPGNVRQLQNAVECAVLMCGQGDIIEPDHLPAYVSEVKISHAAPSGYYAGMAQHQKMLIETALAHAGGQPVEAARMLDISASYFRRLARVLNVKLP